MKSAAKFIPLAAIAFLLAGCEDMMGPSVLSRDFGELIPRMLNSVNTPTPLEAATKLFDATSPDERRDGIAYLQTKPYGHNPPYMKVYQLATTDTYPMVRAQAIMALGTSYQPDQAVSYMIKGLAPTEDVEVRRDAAYALAYTYDDTAVAPLIVCLKGDSDEQVRAYAARALGHARSPEAVRALIDALFDHDAAVTKYAHDSLVSATGQNFWYETRDWIAWYQQTYSPAATTQASKPG